MFVWAGAEAVDVRFRDLPTRPGTLAGHRRRRGGAVRRAIRRPPGRPVWASTTSTSWTSTRASPRPCRWPPRRSACATDDARGPDRHRRPPLLRRPGKQLHHPRHRHADATPCASGDGAGHPHSAWPPGSAGSSPSTPSASTAPTRRPAGSAGATPPPPRPPSTLGRRGGDRVSTAPNGHRGGRHRVARQRRGRRPAPRWSPAWRTDARWRWRRPTTRSWPPWATPTCPAWSADPWSSRPVSRATVWRSAERATDRPRETTMPDTCSVSARVTSRSSPSTAPRPATPSTAPSPGPSRRPSTSSSTTTTARGHRAPGSGDKAFCAGMDLKAFASGEAGEIMGARGGFGGIAQRDFPKPLIAAVNGSALAGGCEIMLSCDLVVAAEHAKFGIPEVKRGLMAGAGGLLRLPKRHPPADRPRAGPHRGPHRRPAGAGARADQPGGPRRPADGGGTGARRDPSPRTRPLAVRGSKKVMKQAGELPEAEGWAINNDACPPVFGSADAMEGAVAFAEKREPRSGREVARPVPTPTCSADAGPSLATGLDRIPPDPPRARRPPSGWAASSPWPACCPPSAASARTRRRRWPGPSPASCGRPTPSSSSPASGTSRRRAPRGRHRLEGGPDGQDRRGGARRGGRLPPPAGHHQGGTGRLGVRRRGGLGRSPCAWACFLAG